MSRKHILAAQLSTVHSSPQNLEPECVYHYICKMVAKVPLDILLIGWEERQSLFEEFTSKERRLTRDVFLWYPFLSDFPEIEPSHLVVNIDLDKSVGWGGYNGTNINETYKQACPNNPEVLRISMKHLEYMLSKYDFDGVFIDKIRFPSMVNGLSDVFSCFCPYCVEKASNTGLDLHRVKALLQQKNLGKTYGKIVNIPPGANWLELLTKDIPLIQQFIRFRADSINQVLFKIAEKVNQLGKKMSLDIFSPGLAPVVGQDFPYMGQFATWVKPMIYRFGNGPSSLRCEITALIRELGNYLEIKPNAVMDWVRNHVEGLGNSTLEEIEKVAPLDILHAETKHVLELFPKTPVYLGLETVSIPGEMTITPRNVEEILEIGEQVGVQGYVLSWDLLHTPLENILPLQAII